MELRNVGSSGLAVSAVGLGTMTWGRDVDEENAREQLRIFVDAGGTLVSTAPRYGDGEAEAMLGGFIGDTVARSELVLCAQAGTVRSGRRMDVSRRGLLDSLDATLSRLQTGHLDLWLVPAAGTVPLEETLSAMETAYRSGRARYVGVADHSAWRFAQLAATAGFPIVAHETEYSLLARAAERDVVPASAALGAGLLAWAALGRGVLTGKYRGRLPADSRGASDLWAPYVSDYLTGHPERVTEALCTAARGLDVQPHELALRWLLGRPGVSSALVGARTPVQLKEVLDTELKPIATQINDVLDEVSAPGY